MSGLRTRLAAVALATGALAVIPAVAATRSSHHPSAADRATAARLAHATLREQSRGEAGGDGDSEMYADRAYPASDVTFDQVRTAIGANNLVVARGAKLTSKWESLGPETLNVDRLGTQAFNKATQWSGRVTALAVDPKCKPQECTLYVAAAGGGVWRSTNALAPNPAWKQISEDLPTNAIGSIAIDPNDKSGRTIYVGTGEGNSSADSEAGLGLYRTVDGGSHWSLVDGSYAVAKGRSITWVAVDPTNASHILFGTRSGTFGESSGNTQTAPVGVAPTGVYSSTDGGVTFALVQPGLINEVKFDPRDANVVYAAQANVGLVRSTAGGAAGTWETIFSLSRSRFSFSPVRLANGKTRIYLADASGGGGPAEVFRIDDAKQPAASMTAGGNAAWTRLSNPTPGTPGYAVNNFCNTPLVGSQCSYDMFVMSPPDRPDMVVVGGLMHYEELKPYAAPGGMRANGRAVLVSFDAGVHWTDATGDPSGESMHPDQHALAFVPGNPDQFFVASDGGVIRTDGTWADASSQCDTRGLSATDLGYCHDWLSKIPGQLQVVNAGLATLQMNSISVSPFSPTDTALAGTQDNGTLAYSGSPVWLLPLTGDGGDAGFDAVDPKFDFHTYTNGQMDVNYNGVDPTSWLWVADWIAKAHESVRFYGPALADTVRTRTIYVGGTRVWRTEDGGGDRTFLEQHCNTAVGEFPSDLLNTGACGSLSDWFPLGSQSMSSAATFGGTKAGGSITAMSRAHDAGTLWLATNGGRVFVTTNVDAASPAVTFTRIDTASQPNRVPSSVTVDPTNPDHAIVTFSGYESNTPTTPGHVFDVVYDPAAGTATWTNISYDIGDQPVNDAVFDAATGDVYASTDFGVLRLVSGTQTWIPAADGLPNAAVPGLTLAVSPKAGDRLLYAATHGRGAYRLRLK
ncbi:MAG TPA: hypothetical protein VI408_02655 [Gaiellaceae bacterium]